MPTPHNQPVIVGLGATPTTRKASASAVDLAVEAIRLAIDDAGLRWAEVDGLLIARSPLAADSLTPRLQHAAGMRDLRLLACVESQGASAVVMLQLAALALADGTARTIVCVFADAPIRADRGGSAAFGAPRPVAGLSGLEAAVGWFGAVTSFALAARRHMALFGTTHDQLGAVAVAARQWAAGNPAAWQRDLLTLEQYHQSRWVVEPFHLLDCALPVNGGIAIVVTTADRARDLRQPAVHVRGVGQSHPGTPRRAGYEPDVDIGARAAGERALRQAGITLRDIDVFECYDAFTYLTLVALEAYGFCERGEGGPFVASGAIAPGGAVPSNTGGGQLASGYLQGMTPVAEAIVQIRRHGAARQVANCEFALVTGQGGRFDHHAAAVFARAVS